MPYEHEYQPPFRKRGGDPLTPMQRLNHHYTTRTGSYQLPANPVPDTGPGAVRRGAGDIWTRVKQELQSIKQGIASPQRPTYPHEEAAGVPARTTPAAEAFKAGQRAVPKIVNKVGEIIKQDRPSYPHEIRNQKMGIGPPAARRTAVVPAAEAGAPASTYDRGEGAPTGTTRLQSAAATGTAPPAKRSTGNRYLDMYYADPTVQKRYLQGLPVGQAPIETIRGTKRQHWSPTTEKEYGTALEAAFGVEHKEEMAKATARSEQQFELAKERIKARKPIQFKEAGIDPETQEVKFKALDPNTGKEVANDADVNAVKQRLNSFLALSPEAQEAELAKMPDRQRILLIQLIRQLGEQQGGR
jgi:hypothetical protein